MRSLQPRLIDYLAGVFIATALNGMVIASPQTIQIIPEAPRYLEPVYARIREDDSGFYSCIYGAQVTMVGTTITVRYQRIIELCNYDYDVELGRFPAGSYSVTLQGPNSTSVPVTTQFRVGAALMSPAGQYPGNQPAVNYSGLWWSPAESGWGLSIAQGATNKLFAVWFVYGASGEPVWYTLQPGEWTSSNSNASYTGPIYKTTGPNFRETFNPASVGVTQVGTGTLQFRYAHSGLLNYVIDGQRTIKNIERQIIE
ncbi:hypothetical protein BH11PSE11_BH11PSE11_03260 [soil metagenome]